MRDGVGDGGEGRGGGGVREGVANATSLTSFTMTAMVVGYALGLVCIPRIISQAAALRVSAGLGLVLTVAILLGSDDSTLLSSLLWGWMGLPLLPDTIAMIALLGLANAMVWPTIWPLALAGLGKFTPQGSAILIMGIAGGAILPLAYGGLADMLSSQMAYVIMIPCYLFIGYYAIFGHKKASW